MVIAARKDSQWDIQFNKDSIVFLFFRGDFIFSNINCSAVFINLVLFFPQDLQIERERTVYNISGGCTALVVVCLLGKLYVANAGDSR